MGCGEHLHLTAGFAKSCGYAQASDSQNITQPILFEFLKVHLLSPNLKTNLIQSLVAALQWVVIFLIRDLFVGTLDIVTVKWLSFNICQKYRWR